MSQAPRRAQLPLPDFADLFDPFQALLGWRPSGAGAGIRVETAYEDGAFVVRAELPGIDPGEDVEVTIAQDVLTIRAQRPEHERGQEGHSEFRYGVFTRSVRLPQGADAQDVSASYRAGIVTVRVGLRRREEPAVRKVEVRAQE